MASANVAEDPSRSSHSNDEDGKHVSDDAMETETSTLKAEMFEDNRACEAQLDRRMSTSEIQLTKDPSIGDNPDDLVRQEEKSTTPDTVNNPDPVEESLSEPTNLPSLPGHIRNQPDDSKHPKDTPIGSTDQNASDRALPGPTDLNLMIEQPHQPSSTEGVTSATETHPPNDAPLGASSSEKGRDDTPTGTGSLVLGTSNDELSDVVVGSNLKSGNTNPGPRKEPVQPVTSVRKSIEFQRKSKTNNVICHLCELRSDQPWLERQFKDTAMKQIKKPDEIQEELTKPPGSIDEKVLRRVKGSIIGMAIGDALGAHVEFRPHSLLVANPVTDLGSGGTWGLQRGQFTDDTSMALCLANSLIASRGFNPYDQLVRYKWWHEHGYMSSTGHCFDIGTATKQSIDEFSHRQQNFADKNGIPREEMDRLPDVKLLENFDVYCSEEGVAGNGALMRLAPVPLFFYKHPQVAVEYSGFSGQITHGDERAYDACRYYGTLIVAALREETKEQLLDVNFYSKHKEWFGEKELHPAIEAIAKGSFRKNGYEGGIRGKGFIVDALEAALWAFWSDENSFEKGALAAVNLGDDTDTTAAIYGQLAGAYYGFDKLPEHWVTDVYAKSFMEKLSQWIVYEGEEWQKHFDAEKLA